MNNTRNTLLDWVASGDLDPNNLEKALACCHTNPSKRQWLSYLSSGLLWAAILFSSLGIIFFFAFNWQDMGRFSKFGLIECIMLLCAPFIFKFSSQRLLITCLMSLSLFTGALLALVGQIYQTGVDPWQLFAVWSVFILPWTFMARSKELWILWIVLLNTSLYLYLELHHGLFGFLNHDQFNALIFAALNTFLLGLFELHYYQQLKQRLAPTRSIQQLLALIAGSAITFLAISIMFYSRINSLYFICYLLWLIGAYVLYRYKHPDLFILSAATLSVILVMISGLINVIDGSFEEGGFFIITIAIIILSTLAGKWLKGVTKSFRDSTHE